MFSLHVTYTFMHIKKAKMKNATCILVLEKIMFSFSWGMAIFFFSMCFYIAIYYSCYVCYYFSDAHNVITTYIAAKQKAQIVIRNDIVSFRF